MRHNLFRTLFALSIITCAAALAFAQERAGNAARNSAPQNNSSGLDARTNADENFDLNIAERHIVENNFEASTAIEAGEESASGLHLRIGVGVGAERIDVLLRNVHGHVHFHGTLDRVLELINTRRTVVATP